MREQDKAFYTYCLAGIAGGVTILFLGVVVGSNLLQFLGLVGLAVSLGIAVWKWRREGAKLPDFAFDTSQRTVIAKVSSRYRTELGQIVTDREIELEHPNYHVVMVTSDGARLEVTASKEAYGEALESAWGYAHLVGKHLQVFQRDAELYRQYND